MKIFAFADSWCDDSEYEIRKYLKAYLKQENLLVCILCLQATFETV